MSDPYRTVAQVAQVVERAQVRGAPDRPRRLRYLLWGAGIAACALGAALGAPFDMIASTAMTTGVIAYTMSYDRRREHAIRALGELPFPIRHDRASATEAWGLKTYGLREVTIRIERALDGVEAERAAAAAAGLSVAAHGDTLVLGAWPCSRDDVFRLEELLASWGRGLHASHAILDVFIAWERGGPPISI
jgi:hypothetical protein